MIRRCFAILGILAGPALAQDDPATTIPEVFRISGPAAIERDFFHRDLDGSIIVRQIWRIQTRTTDRDPDVIAGEIAELTHDEVLSFWLTNVFLGRDCFGIDAALAAYFAVTPETADLRQALTLMSVIRAPDLSLGNPERLNSTYVFLVDEVLKMGHLSFEEATEMAEQGPAEINSSAKCDP